MSLRVVHFAPPTGYNEPEKATVCRTAKTSLWSSVAPQKFKDIVNGINQNKSGPHNTFKPKVKNMGHGKVCLTRNTQQGEWKRSTSKTQPFYLMHFPQVV